ncbi:TetR/AcrR family transcriptional regulator [Gordonia hydrophobica]|uniref:TetR/AcrR family transcriptional regulator n=1 Tax=Gordonia hydrophobica TaxID=40516 RepID=A0ABZ2U1A6_9ACTN|nr:TetR/AcrR family transcriptional regulator [Gordonia hydrophobica]MBM7368520.1 AcrR family transcriptional regulator [Gordonia hydrophobica]
MGRPAKHTIDDFLDAAVAIFADDGVRAVTLAAVAGRLGAANGSVYYRFPDRESLLQAVWLRTAQRFRDHYTQQLGDEPGIEEAIDAAAWIVQWCRDNPAQAQVLQAGPRTFGPDEWPAQEADVHAGHAQLRGFVATLAEQSLATPDEIAFALIELPLAVVRRHLQAGRAPTDRDVELVRRLATVILSRPSPTS